MLDTILTFIGFDGAQALTHCAAFVFGCFLVAEHIDRDNDGDGAVPA